MSTRRRSWILLAGLGFLGLASAASVEGVNRWRLTSTGGDDVFEIKPYLQLGDAPTPALDGTESLALVWQTLDTEADWSVAIQDTRLGPWRTVDAPTSRRIAIDGLAPFRLFHAKLTGLTPGEHFTY